MNNYKIWKFTKVFSLESFPLYSMQTLDYMNLQFYSMLRCSTYDSNQSPTFITGHTIYAGSEGMAVLTPQLLGSACLHFITPTNITMTPPYVPPHTHTPSTLTLSHIHTPSFSTHPHTLPYYTLHLPYCALLYLHTPTHLTHLTPSHHDKPPNSANNLSIP